MYRVEICMSYPEKYCEVLPSDVCGTEIILEDLTRCILLDLFTSVKIDRIRQSFNPERLEGQQSCLIRLQARCAGSSYPLDTQHLEQMELALEDRMSCALVQLLGMVEVECVTIMSSPDDRQKLILLPALM
jgi:hypothetical protein